jgi:hypothetical protein
LYFIPDKCDRLAVDRQVLEGKLQWVEIKRNDSDFMLFLEEVVKLLDGPLPEPNPDCNWCSYRNKIKLSGGKNLGSTIGNGLPLPICPKCGGPMQLKKGKYGDFWSCLNYPTCKGTSKA